MRSGAACWALGAALVAAVAMTPASPAGATPRSAGAAAAVRAADDGGYFFRPGDPMIFDNGGTAAGAYEGHCTGGYAVSGDSGTFLLGPSTCSVIFGSIRGTDRRYGQVVYQYGPDGNALIQEDPGDDAYQIVRDPTTGATPGDGGIVGWTRTDQQTPGMLVGKMGIGTGWTEGRILGAIYYRGEALLCTTMTTGPGDAGGPVWRMDQYGLRALGTIQAYDYTTNTGCYRPIQETLYNYGASLPTFGPSQGRPGYGTFAPGMPWLSVTTIAVPVDNQLVGSLQ